MAQNLWKSPRLVFRAVDYSDEHVLARICANSLSHVNAHHSLPLPQNQKSLAEIRGRLESALVGVLICLPDEIWEGYNKPKAIGVISLNQDPKRTHHRNASVYIEILGEFQGKGYGSESIKWILEYSFMTIGLHRVSIACFEYNERARRLYEKLGFIREGFTRQSMFSQGKWWGEFQLGMLEDEWRAVREKSAL